MEVIKLLTNCNYEPGTVDRISHIVIHYTGALGNAKSNCIYFQQPRGASAHYFVDFDGSVWQAIEDKNIAWHCGGKNRYNAATNNNSIGIEMCVRNKGNMAADSKDWYYEDATVQGTIELTKELMKKYNVPIENVVRHWDCTHKLCGNPYYYNHTKHTWQDFKKALGAIRNGWLKDYEGWKYFENDKYAIGWRVIDHYKYYFDENGVMLTGWQFVDNGWFYFEEPDYSNEGALWVSEENGAQSRAYF